MKLKTLQTLTQNVIYEISQVPGVAVQVYSEPVIQRKIQYHFDRIFSKGWWPQFYTPSLTVNYSSHTGLPTNDFTASPIIKGIEDIRWIFRPGYSKPLPELQAHYNRNVVTGTSPQFWESYPNTSKLFRILPIPDPTMAAAEDTSTYSVVISFRTMPDDFSSSDLVSFDYLYLLYAVCEDILATDGDNPGDIEKYGNMARDRLRTLNNNLSSEILLQQQTSRIPDEWFSR